MYCWRAGWCEVPQVLKGGRHWGRYMFNFIHGYADLIGSRTVNNGIL